MVDIRIYTFIIIEKDRKFLSGRRMLTNELIWSDSPYDAWMTKRLDDSYRVAHKVNGKRFLFNPVSRKLKELVIK